MIEDSKGIDKDKGASSEYLQFEQERSLLHIFRILGNRRTFHRNLLVLDVLNKNPDIYLLKREIQRLLADKLEKHELDHIGDDIRRLVRVNLIQMRGNRYHLSEIGTVIITSIEKIKEELSQPLLQKFTRAMLIGSIYEGKGFSIHSDRHVCQIGFLIIETINDLIEQDRILEWSKYLGKFTQIIESLSNFIESYIDEPEIYQQLFQLKSEIELEFSRYHEMAQKSLSSQLSMIQAGFDPAKMKMALKTLTENQLNKLISSLEPLIDKGGLVESDLLWEIVFEEEKALSGQMTSIDIKDSTVTTEIADDTEVEAILEKYFSEYQIYGKMLLKKFENRPYIFLSDLVSDLKDNWLEIMNLVGSIPSIGQEFNILAVPLDNKINITHGFLLNGLFYNKKGVKELNED